MAHSSARETIHGVRLNAPCTVHYCTMHHAPCIVHHAPCTARPLAAQVAQFGTPGEEFLAAFEGMDKDGDGTISKVTSHN